MEANTTRSSCSRNNFVSINGSFEQKVKLRLSWAREKWQEEEEEGTRMHKLTNSLRFWKKKLLRAQGKSNVILTYFNEEKDEILCLEDLFDAFDNLGKGHLMKGFNTFRNSRYVNIIFDSKETKHFIENNLKKIGNINIVFLSWVSEACIHNISMHWLPPDLDITYSRSFIKKYFEITEESQEIAEFKGGRRLPSGISHFKGMLKKEYNINDIPHVIEIEGLECLITIYGRPYLCLNCNIIGHISRNCPSAYCHTCKQLQSKTHECIQSQTGFISYAQKVRTGFRNNEKEAKNVWGVNATIEKTERQESISTKLPAGVREVELSVNDLNKKEKKDKQGKLKETIDSSSSVMESSNHGVNKMRKKKKKRRTKEITGDKAIMNPEQMLTNQEEMSQISDEWTSNEDDSSNEESQQTNSALEMLNAHLEDLNKFKLPVLPQDLNFANSNTLQKDFKDINDETSKMVADGITLKRKINNSRIKKESNGVALNTRKTYGRRGVARGGGRGHKPTNMYESLMDAILDSKD